MVLTAGLGFTSVIFAMSHSRRWRGSYAATEIRRAEPGRKMTEPNPLDQQPSQKPRPDWDISCGGDLVASFTCQNSQSWMICPPRTRFPGWPFAGISAAAHGCRTLYFPIILPACWSDFVSFLPATYGRKA
jgi:hypothetical protein